MKNLKIFFILILITTFLTSCFLFPNIDSDIDSENNSTELINLNPDPDGDPWIAGGAIELTEEEREAIPPLSSILGD
mgnify:CR=1 FL=1